MPTIGNIGDELNLIIKQGSTFKSVSVELTNNDGTPFNLTSCILRAHVRKEPSDPTPVAAFDFTITDFVGGKFFFTLSSTVTTGLTAGKTIKDRESQYVWDCELVDSLGEITPLYYGSVKVFREVTHD